MLQKLTPPGMELGVEYERLCRELAGTFYDCMKQAQRELSMKDPNQQPKR